jgi:hypothetical protein
VPWARTQIFRFLKQRPRLRYRYSHITVWLRNRQPGAPATCLGVAVLGALQAVEYRTQSLITGGFVLLYASGFAGEFCHPSGEARALLGSQDTPGESAVCSLKIRFFMAAFEQTFEGGVKGFSGLQWEV